MPDPLFDLAGRIAVVTGACGLIGRAIAQAFAHRGALVVAVDLPAAMPQSLVPLFGGEALAMPCDVTDAGQVETLVQRVLDLHGRVDILVNSHHHKAKGFTEIPAESFPEELWDSIVSVQLKATFLTCRAFGKAMLSQGKGSIVNLASTYGVVSSNPGLYEDNSLGNPVAYTASKGGVIMLTKYLGVHWASRGVRVNCVTPQGVLNGQPPAFIERFRSLSPMRRLMTADEVVGAVLFLASDAASYATASNLLIEGGWSAW
jgi:NAD(P)-dependent dehydrogenase (short-subunit alcohol dehydrogenase family)